jgi:N-acetyl-D-muramate 6-phosphate phosphatase
VLEANHRSGELSSSARTRAVLLDLDGTLLDTAPDMVGAMNALRREEGLDPLPFEQGRRQVSHGATALVRLAFPKAVEPELTALRERFLQIYSRHVCVETTIYEGVSVALERLEAAGIPWGIVTNKPSWLAEPLLERLDLRHRAGVVVCGDTVAERKPHPAPLLHAANTLRVAPPDCTYIGDAERDVLAARAANMQVFVALFGYIALDERPMDWPATGWLDTPQAMCGLLLELLSTAR